MEYKYTGFIRDWLGMVFAKNKYLDVVWQALEICPICTGSWAGFVIFLVFCFDFSRFDVRQLIEFPIFAYTVGFLSLVLETLWSPLLNKYSEEKMKKFAKIR